MHPEIIFDITADPPQQELVLRATMHIRNSISRIRGITNIVIILLLAGAIWAPVLAATRPPAPGKIRQMVTQSMSIVPIILVPALYWAHNRKQKVSDLEWSLARLAPISGYHCTQFIGWCRAYEEIRQYQNKTAAIRRPLTEAEYYAAMSWLESHGEERDDISRRMLRQPVTAAPDRTPEQAPGNDPAETTAHEPTHEAATPSPTAVPDETPSAMAKDNEQQHNDEEHTCDTTTYPRDLI
jgi:hypothetical protein